MNELEKTLGLIETSPTQKVLDDPSGYMLKQIPKVAQTYEMLVFVCSQDGMALKHASRKLITPELCEIAVKQNGLAISHVPDRIIKAGDIRWLRHICELAVVQNGLALESIPESIIQNEEVEWLNHLYKEAARSNGQSLRFIPNEFKSPEIIEAAILSNGEISKHSIYKSPIAYVPKEMLTQELILAAVKHFPLCIKDIPKNRITKVLSEIAVSKNGLTLRYIPSRFISEKLIQLAVTENAHAIRFVPEEYLTPKLYLHCFDMDCTVLGYLPAELITEEMCLKAIRQRKFSVDKLSDRLMIRYYGSTDVKLVLFADFPESLRNNRSLLDAIIQRYKYGSLPLIIWNNDLIDRRERFPSLCVDRKGAAIMPLTEETVAYLKTKEITPKAHLSKETEAQDIVLPKRSALTAYGSKAELPLPTEIPSAFCLIPRGKNELTMHDFSDCDRQQRKLYYISDIHIEHHLSKEMEKHPLRPREKISDYIIRFLEKKINGMMPKEIIDRDAILLIGGDVADSVGVSALFYQLLFQKWKGGTVISVLGNHELWDGTNPLNWVNPRFKSRPVEDIIESYRSHIDRGWWCERDNFDRDRPTTTGLSNACYVNSKLLENALYIRYKDRLSRVVSEEEILNASYQDLTELLSKCTFILLGGIGYSGLNPKYNSDLGLYGKAITSLEEDKWRAERFRKVHDKIKQCAKGRKVVVLTHTPVNDWTEDECVKNWIYVNGHTHQNAINISPDGITVLSDNQIGYKPIRWKLHSFTMDICWFDPFENYEDGIYEISSDQYKDFNRGRGIPSNGCSWPGVLYLLKRKKKYMFLLQSEKSLCLMVGGQRKRIGWKDIQYYYDNMERYVKQVLQITEPYRRFMKRLSEEVKKIGGDGKIHGCIVDISYFSHIYVNPFEGKLTPYWALDITGRIVYDNIRMLLEARERPLLKRFMIECDKQSIPLIETFAMSEHKPNELAVIPRWMSGTEIYNPSRIMKSIQYVWEQDVIRIWNDDILDGNYLDEKPPLIEYNGSEII